MIAAPSTPCYVALAGEDAASAVRIIGRIDSCENARFLKEHRTVRVVVRPLAEAQRLLLNFGKIRETCDVPAAV